MGWQIELCKLMLVVLSTKAILLFSSMIITVAYNRAETIRNQDRLVSIQTGKHMFSQVASSLHLVIP